MNKGIVISACLGSYLVGSIPTAYLICHFRGIDIRQIGSGNPGATNVYRALGKGAAAITLSIDILKGLIPTWLALKYFSQEMAIFIGLSTIAGHTWTIFLRFRGGKGVATSLGVFATLLPIPTLFSIAAWFAGWLTTKHISVGSILGAVVLPAAAWLLPNNRQPIWLPITATVVGIIVIIRHWENIKRLIHQKEIGIHS